MQPNDIPRSQGPLLHPLRSALSRGGASQGQGQGGYVPYEPRGAGGYGNQYPANLEQPRPHGVKLEVQSFGLICEPEVYLDWEQKTDQIFQYYNYSEAQRVAIATIKFEGFAYQWWLGHKEEREFLGHP